MTKTIWLETALMPHGWADHPSLASRRGDALLDGWIFAGRGSAIDTVWRRGCKVVRAGRHVHAQAIAARYRRTLRKLLVA